MFDSVALTVANREVFISIGTGNEIFELNSAQYRKEYAIQVTDSTGAGVAGVTVQLSILSDFYYKGFWSLPLTGPWQQTINAGCVDEDFNRNGVLDPMEDTNFSGQIEAGNIATVSVQGVGGGTMTTDQNGFGIVDVIYPQEFARWLDVTLEARTSVQGTEFAEPNSFTLSILADDVTDRNASPPRQTSPFGVGFACDDTV